MVEKKLKNMLKNSPIKKSKNIKKINKKVSKNNTK